MLDWDKYETNIYVVSEAFDGISINADTTDIVFAISNDGKCRVESYEGENTKHSVSVENNMLVVSINPKSWHDYIGFHFGSPKIFPMMVTIFL